MGKPGAIGDADVQAAIACVLDACRRVDKACGIFLVDATSASRAFGAGHSLVCLASETLILGGAAADLARAART